MLSDVVSCRFIMSVASAVFLTTLLQAVFAASYPIFVAICINSLPYLSPNFLPNDKESYPATYSLYFDSAEYLIFIRPTNYESHINIVFYFKLLAILISNHYSMDENSVSVVINIVNE